MVSAVSRSPLRHAVTNVVAASCGDPAAASGTVVVVVDGAVVVVVSAELEDDAAVGAESALQPRSATAHVTTAARRIIEST
jgi:hypothetical protein